VSSADVRPGPASPPPHDPERAGPSRSRTLLIVALVLVVVASVTLRLLSSGPLWLDESLSAEIARRPLGPMFTALRHDGSPPLYYLLLHAWIEAFGDSTPAVRALSSVFGVLSLPLAWWAGQQLGGRRLAPWALLTVAMAPWTFRYATETRMYMLLFDLVLLGAVLLTRALQRPSTWRLVAVGLDTLAIAYTHYWGLYVLAPVALGLLLARRWRVLSAMALSAVGYLPWLPSLLFQLKHTGTPWAQPPSLSIFTDTVTQWGGAGQTGALFGVGLLLLAVAGVAYRVSGSDHAVRQLDGRLLAAAAAAPLVVALLLGYVTHAGYAIRYTAVALPAFLLLVALGITRLPVRGRAVAAVLIVVLGLVAGISQARTPRTQAGAVAASLKAQARPGDVVGFCPDQLSPAVHRLLPASLDLTQIAYADPTEGPALVDWVDYAQRVATVTPQEFTAHLLAAAGTTHTVWLVSQDGYRVFGGLCPDVAADLQAARGDPTTTVVANLGIFEHESLSAYPIRISGPSTG
jgi:mannosyltransferase